MEVGEEVSRFKIGDLVCGFPTLRPGYSTFAQYCFMSDIFAMHQPKHWAPEHAATVGVASLTAADGLYRHLALPFKSDSAEKTILARVYPPPPDPKHFS